MANLTTPRRQRTVAVRPHRGPLTTDEIAQLTRMLLGALDRAERREQAAAAPVVATQVAA